jgi:hypothetical protein
MEPLMTGKGVFGGLSCTGSAVVGEAGATCMLLLMVFKSWHFSAYVAGMSMGLNATDCEKAEATTTMQQSLPLCNGDQCLCSRLSL